MENDESFDKAKKKPNLEELQSSGHDQNLQIDKQHETNLEQVLNENSEARQASKRFDRSL
ncbi:hypothetical protein [Peribacillus acanthi]|uniref:hypothetical protein n=1 Tax=Peribacillus acanthi TaxID=2171554 RepID=UPI000D3E2607|nr:hypothetical protein [Peribacillus acanthi]